jgi:hypothetical protein
MTMNASLQNLRRIGVVFTAVQGDDGPELIADVQEHRPGASPLSYLADVPALQTLISALQKSPGQLRPTAVGWEWVRKESS